MAVFCFFFIGEKEETGKHCEKKFCKYRSWLIFSRRTWKNEKEKIALEHYMNEVEGDVYWKRVNQSNQSENKECDTEICRSAEYSWEMLFLGLNGPGKKKKIDFISYT